MKTPSFLALWLPLATLAIILCGTIYMTVQHNYRMSANDPQLQIAEDAATQLSAGVQVLEVIPKNMIAIESSLAPYSMVYDAQENFVAGNGLLHGLPPQLPHGVLAEAGKRGAYTVTWQPEKGVRQALVIVAYTHGYVVSGRSLREVEKRINNTTTLIEAGLLACFVATGLLSFLRIRFVRG
jgi:hypothetical protein